MRPRNISIFSIFILVAVYASFFVYFYHQKTNQVVNKYIAQITSCGNILSEEDCYARDFCEGIYGPTCVGCSEVEFLRCVKVSPKLEAELSQQRGLCEQTGGTWYRNKLGNFCLCSAKGPETVFDQTYGCK